MDIFDIESDRMSGIDYEVLQNYYSSDKIEDKLYLGDWYSMASEHRLNWLNIKRVLSITHQTIRRYEGILYKQINAKNRDYTDLLTTFPECIQFITDGHNRDQRVYVHCKSGTSRSVTIVIAFLMYKYKISYESAQKMVSDKRYINPNQGFVEQLKLFELMNYTIDFSRKEYVDYLARIEEKKRYLNLIPKIVVKTEN